MDRDVGHVIPVPAVDEEAAVLLDSGGRRAGAAAVPTGGRHQDVVPGSHAHSGEGSDSGALDAVVVGHEYAGHASVLPRSSTLTPWRTKAAKARSDRVRRPRACSSTRSVAGP